MPDDRVIEAQRVAAFEKEKQDEATKTKQAKEEARRIRKSNNKSNQGECLKGHTRDENRDYNSSSRRR